VHKTSIVLPDQYEGTVIWWIFKDVGSASHPTSAIAAAALGEAAGLIHANPVLAVMPDDPALGEWRKEFAGVLGWIEEYPSVPKDAPAFFGAQEVLDSEELLEKMNKDPDTRIDDKTFLRAVLLDLVLGDNDRHPLQWKWIQTEKKKSAPWRPMPRDRDKVFVSYEGTLLSLARKFESSLVAFRPEYPDPTALFRNAVEYDRRMLADLDRSEWDAAVRDIQQRLTNRVIDDAVAGMPREYAASSKELAEIVKARRDALGDEATRYYLQMWNVADIHGTDAADRATINRAPDGKVQVTLQSGKDEPYFSRSFDPVDTRRIRVYLHEGDDSALITGSGPSSSIAVRVIGGNGNNSLVDQSTVAGHRNSADLYDQGPTSGVKYARDTVGERPTKILRSIPTSTDVHGSAHTGRSFLRYEITANR
jgi:hypothetical protein